MRTFLIAAGLACLLVLAICAGCTSSSTTPSYSVDSNGILSVICAPVTTNETVLYANGTYTESQVILHTQTGDVTTYLSYPKNPKAVLLYLPGAGEKITGHAGRMVQYAADGYAFMFLDYRGRGGETAGYPFNPQTDYALFENKEWPEYYLTICDISLAQAMLTTRFGVPVYAIGGSNGGRYAAVAAGVDKNFAGYIGISTADWGVKESVIAQGGSGDILRFATSIEPSTYLPTISPRPVWMYHNVTDPIIPFADGQALFATAHQPKTFTEFNGDHGINPDVDNRLMALLAQIYGTQA